MVRLCTSLLALALATGTALAFSDDYQRREFVDSQETYFTREDHEDLYGREDFEDFEAREPIGLLFAAKMAGKMGKLAFGAFRHRYSSQFRRDLDPEELFGREYDHLDEREIIGDLD